eukprot:scaffold11057_cov78-Cyclotella_meneghiniana.AAC.3
MTKLSTETVLTTTGLLGAVAWFLSLFGAVYCKFLTNTLTMEFGQGRKLNLNYGIWTYQGFGIASTSDETVLFETCRPYPSETYLDPKWNSAMAFSTMSIIIGGVTTLWTLFAMCGTTPIPRINIALLDQFRLYRQCLDIRSVGKYALVSSRRYMHYVSLPTFMTGMPPLDKVEIEHNAGTTEDKLNDPDSALNKDGADEEIGDEHTLETTEAA